MSKVPATAKALLLQKNEGRLLVIGDVPVHKPLPGEILIKIHATALNPVDWKIPTYGLFPERFTLPTILGNDLAGEVVELGEGVTDFKVGDRVFGQAHFEATRGTFQQYLIALASTTAKIPPNITYEEAATIPTALTAAYVGLYNKIPHGLGIVSPLSDLEGAQKFSGSPILLFGGASSVGQAVLQLARLSGFSPIITTASLKHTDWLKSLGATHVLDRNLDAAALAASVKKLSGGKPLKYIYDSISSPATQKTGFDLLADGGSIGVVLPPITTSTEAKTVVQIQGILTAPPNVALLEQLYHDHLYKLVEEGSIKPNKVQVLPNGLAGIPAGLDKLEADQISGFKLVAHPQETA